MPNPFFTNNAQSPVPTPPPTANTFNTNVWVSPHTGASWTIENSSILGGSGGGAVSSVAYPPTVAVQGEPLGDDMELAYLPEPEHEPQELQLQTELTATLHYYHGQDMTNDTKQKQKFYNRKLTTLVNNREGKKTGLIGLEIECEGTHLFDNPFAYWTCHNDGSLRATGEHPPIEYVLRQPLSVEDARKALNYLEAKLKAAKSSVTESSRTSVHVHVNCQELTVRQLYCYILLYLIFEEILVQWSGPEREGNLFCLRAKDSDFFVHMLEESLKKSDLRTWKEDLRYTACNVNSILKFGSLEFRSLRGTVDMQIINQWIDLLVNLKDKAAEYDNPVQIVEEFAQIGPLPFLKKIFDKPDQLKLLEAQRDLPAKLWDGLRLMRDVAYSCEWEQPLKKIPGEPEPTEESPELLVKRGQFFDFGSRNYEVFCKFNNTNHNHHPDYTYRAWESLMALRFGSNAIEYAVPANHTAYMIRPIVDGPDSGAYCVLDVRPGKIETRESIDPEFVPEGFAQHHVASANFD